MTTFLMEFVGAGIHATLSTELVGEIESERTAVPVLGVDPAAAEQGWIGVSARRLDDVTPRIRVRVPHYQGTAYLAAAHSSNLLAVGIEQTVLLFQARQPDLGLAELHVQTPLMALLSLDGELLVVHEAGVDRVTPGGLITVATGFVSSWRVQSGRISIE